MGRDSRYTSAFKAEVVAYARMMGAEQAAEHYAIGKVDTVRSWLSAAGDGPELGIPAGQWQAIFDLAAAKVQTALTSGKLSAVQLATVAGIAKRNLDKPREPEPGRLPAEEWVDALEPYLPRHRWADAIRALMDWLDTEPEDISEEATIAYLTSLDLDQWRRDRDAREAAYLADMGALGELTRLRYQPGLDDDTRQFAEQARSEAFAAIRRKYPERFPQEAADAP